MDVHIDNLHYLNDILSTGNPELVRMKNSVKLFSSFSINNSSFSTFQNNLVIGSLNRNLIGPIYLASLASIRAQSQTILVSPVTALFLLSQFLRIVQERSVIEAMLSSLFFGDKEDIRTEWTRTLDRGLHLAPVAKWENVHERWGSP
jgi:hypothetical protein